MGSFNQASIFNKPFAEDLLCVSVMTAFGRSGEAIPLKNWTRAEKKLLTWTCLLSRAKLMRMESTIKKVTVWWKHSCFFVKHLSTFSDAQRGDTETELRTFTSEYVSESIPLATVLRKRIPLTASESSKLQVSCLFIKYLGQPIPGYERCSCFLLL